jgi:Fe-S-cluster-containing dehydrogenase component
MCQQCANAPCVHVCPTGASFRDEQTNIVQIDKERCIGCKYCLMACPYGVRNWNEAETIVEKCTLCSQLTAVGDSPACVKACCGKARFYGDLDDPSSDAAKALAEKAADARHSLPDVGNNPQTAYLLSPIYGHWDVGDIKDQSVREAHMRGDEG